MTDIQATSDKTPDETGSGVSYATWQDRQLAVILARTGQLLRELSSVARSNERLSVSATELLESREAELRKLADREAMLVSDLKFWQAQAGALEKRLEQQLAEQQSMQEEIARLSAAEKNYAAENQILHSRATASAYEATNLRRLVSGLQGSLSWKITGPLRFLTKPLFRSLAPKAAPQHPAGLSSPPTSVPAAGVSLPGTAQEPGHRDANPLDLVLSELRRARSIVVIPCAVPFSATFNQRPISFARCLADHGSTVLFVVWQWSSDEVVPAGEVYPGVFSLPLYTFQNHIGSIAAASHARSAYLCTLPSPGLVEAVLSLRADGYHIHYDIMDDWEEFHGSGEAPWFSASVEREMVVIADTVTTVSEALAKKFDHLRSDIVVVRNGYQPSALGCEQFIVARAPLNRPKVVGYFGHLSDVWFDWETVFYAAGKLKDIEFELIGYGLSERSRVRLADFPNVRFMGLVAQSDLHRYAQKWWAGMIPFRPTTLSAAVDPLKIYEYLHLGLPTVVTGIPGIAHYPLVQFAADPDSFVSVLDQLRHRPEERHLSEVAAFLKACVWEERLARLNSIMNQPAGLPFLYAH